MTVLIIFYLFLVLIFVSNQESQLVVKEELMGDLMKQLEAIQEGMLTRDEIEKIRPEGFYKLVGVRILNYYSAFSRPQQSDNNRGTKKLRAFIFKVHQ